MQKGSAKCKTGKKAYKKKNDKNDSGQHAGAGQQARRQAVEDDPDLPTDMQTHLVKKCLYCDRKNCDDCPLPFNDKITLRNFLLDCNITISESPYFRNDD